jgi:glycosyltransferase involved in cell wall biosynthesis
MASLPRVSLIAPIHNGGTHYSVCFESLCHLEYPDDLLEIHIIDDCSTDGTREFLQRQSHPDFMRIHYPEANMGRARVRNYGLGHITGEVVILLDGDMEIQPDFVQAHVSELSKPGRKAVIGRVAPAPWLPKSRLNHYLYQSHRRGAKQFGPDKPIGFQYVLTNNLALSREALEVGGEFEESFRYYGGEDTLFGYRLTQKYPNGIFFSEGATARHHHHRTLGQHLNDFGDYGYNNLSQIMHRHPEIAAPLAADFAWPFPGDYFRKRRRTAQYLFNFLTASLARLLLPFTPVPLSDALVRFLVVSSVVRGLRRYVQDHQIEASLPAPPGSDTSE